MARMLAKLHPLQVRAINLYNRACNQLAHDFGIQPVPEKATRDEAEAMHRAMSDYHAELSLAHRERGEQEAGRRA